MSEKITVKTKTKVSKNNRKYDILSSYGVPKMLDQIVNKEKINLLNKLECGAVVVDSLNNLMNSENFIIEIPSGLREMLKSGKAVFDKSNKNLGAFTPNIRIIGEAGIKGQASIVKKVDHQDITKNLSNLAMMAMVQSILEKLETIEEKIDDIKQGQKNDRIGTIIGYFKAFIDLYSTFKSADEMNIAANSAYMGMQSGLSKLHLQIDEERKKLSGAPSNHFQTLLQSITNPFSNKAAYYQKCYEDYVYDIQLYNRLILLSDIILYLKGDNDAMRKNHDIMVKYCNQYLDDNFIKKVTYLTDNKIVGISNILEYNKNLDIALKGLNINDIRIECRQNDVKYLNLK